ncbi:MAG: deoxynucleoside kinase [Bacteroidetes bacterium]|nr:deoxynucleoside kinase [Bacteroidota bacterium]
MKYHFISIDGNIGSGKTTLARLLAKRLNARLILEKAADNPFLPAFYEDPASEAFPLELFFLAERYKQLKERMKVNDLFYQATIADYYFGKCLLFAKINLPEEEFRLFAKFYESLLPQLQQPDLLIYLHAPVHTLKKNIDKRNRSFEKGISLNYLHQIQETYSDYIKQHHLKTIYIDVSNADFLRNETHIDIVLNAIKNNAEETRQFFSLP